MSKIFTFYKADKNGPENESQAVENGIKYFAFFNCADGATYDKANIKAFKLYMKMTKTEGEYDMVSNEIGAKDRKKGIVYDKGKEYTDAHDRAAIFFLSLLHRMVWKKTCDPAQYNDKGVFKGIDW